ncbi:MAG: tetratricopeptide repeat protein [Pirellulaceae bacterium]
MKRIGIISFTLLVLSFTSYLHAQDADQPKAAAKEAAPVAVSDVEAKQAEELFQDGRKLFFQGKYAEAVKKLREAADRNPAKATYKLLLAKAHRYAKQDAEAVKVFEEILKTNPDHVEAGIELAELLSPTKEPDRVIAVLEPLLKYKHDYPLYHLLAESYYHKEEFDQSRKYFEEAVKLNPRSAQDHYQLGNIYLSQKRFAKAAEAYETAGGLGQTGGAYHFKLASVYFNLRNFMGHVTTAEVIGGKPGELKDDLYLIDAEPGRQDVFHVAGKRSALYQAVKAQQLGVDIFDLHFLEANVWLSARRYAQADAIYKSLEEKVGKEEAGLFWFYWAQTALGLEDYDNYLARLDKAIEAEPDVYAGTKADALVVIANRYQQEGKSEEYTKYLAMAVDANPLSAQLHLLLGDAHWLASQHEPAIQQYQLVLELEPDHPQRVRLLNRIRGQQ